VSLDPQTADRELELDYLAAILSWCVYTTDPLVTPARTEDRVEPHDLAWRPHEVTLRALWRLCDSDVVPDVVRLRTALEGAGVDLGIVSRLSARQVLPRLLPAIAGRLRDLAARRRVSAALARASEAAKRGEFEDAREHVNAATDFANAGVAAETETATQTCRTAIAELTAKRGPALGTGFWLLDRATGGLRARTMTVLGGGQGSGKSSLALAIAMHMVRLRVPVGIVSCEDAQEVWGPRVLGHLVDVAVDDFRDKAEDPQFQQQCAEGLALTHDMGLHFFYALNRPLAAVLAGMRQLVQRDGCRLLVVDYVQAIMLGMRQKRNIAVSDAAQNIKAEAQALGVHVILCSQLSRPPKDKPFSEPHAGDLKESGDLENMAEIIALLWKTSDEEDAPTHGKIAKIKWSPKRPRFSIAWQPHTGAIVDLPIRTKTDDNQHSRGYGN
jgi:replicative DNA helicase